MNTKPSLKKIIEAALLTAGKPISIEQLIELFDESTKPNRAAIQEALKELALDYELGVCELKELASGYRLQVRGHFSPWVGRIHEGKPQKYSRALLETLALVAYRQPVTRGEIEEIRGVSVSSGIMRTLLERKWVRIVGYRELPGRPAMFATTRQFLDYFNLTSLDQLPSLTEVRDLEEIAREIEDDFVQAGLNVSAPSSLEAESILDPSVRAEETSMIEKAETAAEKLFVELDSLEETLPKSFDDLLKGHFEKGPEDTESPERMDKPEGVATSEFMRNIGEN